MNAVFVTRKVQTMFQIEKLNERELYAAIGREVPRNQDLDELGYEIAYEATDANGLGLKNVWDQVKTEFKALIFTDDPRYETIRQQAKAISPKNTAMVVSFLSAGLGAIIGVSATVIAPLVGLLLLIVLRIGVETYCDLTRKP
jgi:hypothetical protein